MIDALSGPERCNLLDISSTSAVMTIVFPLSRVSVEPKDPDVIPASPSRKSYIVVDP
jgi:hypothetical protein